MGLRDDQEETTAGVQENEYVPAECIYPFRKISEEKLENGEGEYKNAVLAINYETVPEYNNESVCRRFDGQPHERIWMKFLAKFERWNMDRRVAHITCGSVKFKSRR
mgnify:CR=1 FL=1